MWFYKEKSMNHVKHILEARNCLPGIISFNIILLSNIIFNCFTKSFAIIDLFNINKKVSLFIIMKLHFVTLVLYERCEHYSINDIINPNSS